MSQQNIIIPLYYLISRLKQGKLLNSQALHFAPLTNYTFDTSSGMTIEVKSKFSRSDFTLDYHIKRIRVGNSSAVCVAIPLFIYVELLGNPQQLSVAELQKLHKYQLPDLDYGNRSSGADRGYTNHCNNDCCCDYSDKNNKGDNRNSGSLAGLSWRSLGFFSGW